MKAKLTLLGIVTAGVLTALTFGQHSQPAPQPVPTGNPCSFKPNGDLTGNQLILVGRKMKSLEGEAEESGFSLTEVCEYVNCLADAGIHGTIYARKFTKEV